MIAVWIAWHSRATWRAQRNRAGCIMSHCWWKRLLHSVATSYSYTIAPSKVLIIMDVPALFGGQDNDIGRLQVFLGHYGMHHVPTIGHFCWEFHRDIRVDKRRHKMPHGLFFQSWFLILHRSSSCLTVLRLLLWLLLRWLFLLLYAKTYRLLKQRLTRVIITSTGIHHSGYASRLETLDATCTQMAFTVGWWMW